MINKKKVAIITHYYGSINYGGNLQAYALPYFLNKNGYDAFQISYPLVTYTSGESLKQKLIRKFKESTFACFKSICVTIIHKTENLFHKKDIKKMDDLYTIRYESFKHFNLDLIPHTGKEYFDNTLQNLNNEFDIFITGSDQVFNFNLAKPGYFLNFVNDDKVKLSYAASLALDAIPENKKGFMKNSLKSYKAISVREEKTVKLLSDLTGRNIELNIDPTLLLDKEEWDKVASDRLIEDDYLFCYFLGNNQKEREVAKEYAKKNNLKIICIPMYKTKYKQYDMEYGDTNLPFASPEDFISLIKHAKYIFTDSFHACIFSLIYSKQFVVFNRDSKGNMSSRITSLMKLFHTDKRFTKDENLENVEKILMLNTDYVTDDFKKLKNKSIEFLMINLGTFND